MKLSALPRVYMTLLAVLLACFLLPAVAQNADVSGDLEAANALSAILQKTHSLRANVEQLTLDQDGREIQEFQARLVLEKPDHFYWEIVSPYQELLLTDGIRIWRYEQDLEQVSIDPFNNDISRTPVLLLNGDAAAIAESYSISSAALDYGSQQHFILIPKAPDSLFERLSLSFNDQALTEMQFEDSLGQKTSLTFTSMVTNEAIDPATFVFEMPSDIEVIDNTGF